MKFKHLSFAACLYFTVSTSCFANDILDFDEAVLFRVPWSTMNHLADSLEQLEHVCKSLESAKSESAAERAVEVLKYGIVPLFVNFAAAVVGVIKTTRIRTDTDYSPLPYLMVPHPLGFWSDYATVVRQAKDLGEEPQDAILRLNLDVVVAAPFLPLVCIYRILNRERVLQQKINFLKSKILILQTEWKETISNFLKMREIEEEAAEIRALETDFAELNDRITALLKSC